MTKQQYSALMEKVTAYNQALQALMIETVVLGVEPRFVQSQERLYSLTYEMNEYFTMINPELLDQPSG